MKHHTLRFGDRFGPRLQASPMAQQPIVGQGLLVIETSRSHTRHTTVGRTPLDECSAPRRDLTLPDDTQHSQQTDIEPTIPASERLQTHSLELAAHWNRPSGLLLPKQLSLFNDYLYRYLTRINAKLVNTTILKTV
jgi:hypothetical protein